VADPQYTPPTKTCRQCGIEKPVDAFRPRNDCGDARPAWRGECRACEVARPRDRQLRREYRRARQAAGLEPKHSGRRAGRQHDVREHARDKLKYAVKHGKIAKPGACQECGSGGRIDGHHADYSRPYDVEWLCPRCHGKRHRLPDVVDQGAGETSAGETEG
jgi:hypothetical protein